MAFKFEKLEIDGVLAVEPAVYNDERGFFMEYYNKGSFQKDGGFADLFVQDNHSRSKKGVLRGLHYQLNPSAMGKLVKVVSGEIFDVGVDVRKGSKTFGKWYGEILSGNAHRMLYFPPGFAHGFLALSDNVELLYKCTGMYNPSAERALLWNDPEIGIDWPLAKVSEVIVSSKDQQNKKLKEIDQFE